MPNFAQVTLIGHVGVSVPRRGQVVPARDGGRWNGCIPGNHATGRQILDIGYLPFAILTITGWHEKGQMGWWAMVANEKGKPDWDAECHEILSANEDKLFYLVDCHI